MGRGVDPITVEIIRRSFLAIADEMKITLTRSSHNPIIYEVLDFSVGLFDAKAQTLAQAPGLPIFIANLGAAIQDGLELIGEENLEDGDVIITNDPYTTGTHLPDMTIYAPIVYRGRIIGFAGSRAHWVDVGGRAPGGWYTDTSEVFQEGLRLRSVKLVERGRLNENVVRIITHNVRYPRSIYGDMMAQIAAINTGVRRVKQLAEKYGLEVVLEAMDLMMRQTEEYVRGEIKKLGRAEVEEIGYLERIGSQEPIRLAVKILVNPDRGEVTFDFSNTSPQIPEPLNCGAAAAISAARVAFRAVIRPDLPTDEGAYRPLNIVLPPGRVISAQPPAPVSLYGLPLMTLIDLIVRGFTKIKPEATIAGMYDDVDATFIWSIDPRSGSPYIHIEPQAGGWGAKPHADGENALIAIADGDTYNVPVEVVENRYPLLIEQYNLVGNSGGPGRYRGGLGLVRIYYLDHEAYTTFTFFRHRYPAWGVFNGYPAGAVNTVVIARPDGSIQGMQMATSLKLEPGTRLILITGGGGGWGDPRERPVEKVVEDLLNGYIDETQAREAYGVAIDPSGRVDEQLTKKLRASAERRTPHHCPYEDKHVNPITRATHRLASGRKGGRILEVTFIHQCPSCGRELWRNTVKIDLPDIFAHQTSVPKH